MRALHNRERLTIGSLLLAAVMMALIPWWPKYGDDPAPFVSSSLLAAALLLAAILARHGRVRDGAAITLAAGAWALLSPILLAFWDDPIPLWSHIAAGVLAVLLSARDADWGKPYSQAVRIGTLIGREMGAGWDPRRSSHAARLLRLDRQARRPQRRPARSASDKPISAEFRGSGGNQSWRRSSDISEPTSDNVDRRGAGWGVAPVHRRRWH